MRKSNVYQPTRDWANFALKLLLPNLGLFLILILLSPDSTAWLSSDVWQRSGMLMGIITAAAVTYFILLHLMGIKIKQLLRPMPASE